MVTEEGRDSDYGTAYFKIDLTGFAEAYNFCRQAMGLQPYKDTQAKQTDTKQDPNTQAAENPTQAKE